MPQHEAEAEEVHGPDPEALAPADGLVDVEGDGLVLGLLEGVPHEEVPDGVVAPKRAADLLAAEHQLGQGGGEVLQRRGGGQVRDRGKDALPEPEPGLGEPLVPLGRVAELGQPVVEDPVLPPVHRLLADEPGDLALERRVGDLVAVVANRPHEVVLAIGEDRGQRHDHVAGNQVAVGGEVAGQIPHGLLEGHPSGRDLPLRVARLGHRGRLGHVSPASRSAACTHGRLNERFTQILYFLEHRVSPAPDQTPETKGAQTRRAILQAAIARFGRDGFRATSVADIARDASVGGTVAYAYFPNKEALFLAAVDEDAAGVIQEGLATVLDVPDVRRWHDTLIFSLVDAVEHHPLARRLLAGLEPEVTVRVLEIPALNELRKACTEMLRTGQAAGTVRPDIDPTAVGNGVIALMLAVLMSVTQIGSEAAVAYSQDVAAVFEAALTAPPTP